MARHSRWAQIKRQKGATDVKRGALFTKLANAITAAAASTVSDNALFMGSSLLRGKDVRRGRRGCQ